MCAVEHAIAMELPFIMTSMSVIEHRISLIVVNVLRCSMIAVGKAARTVFHVVILFFDPGHSNLLLNFSVFKNRIGAILAHKSTLCALWKGLL